MTKNLTAGIFAVVLGTAYLIGAFMVPVYEAGDMVGPRAFPFLVSAIVIVSGAALIAKDLRAPERTPFAWGFAAEPVLWLRILAIMALGIVYGLVLDWLGYPIATFLFMTGVGSLINVGKPGQNLLIAAIFALVTFVVFAMVLNLSLPRGLLGDVLPF
ncbi:conserved membrane hypothetical protein [uncultured Alphaproteobacteria bacterium]|uniref:DUF1468 domain-containing protein n=1 Tax=uncultured Alphaproteobacteria bacterium TaxID=91750 RepID=A0A212K209_9PROT|nr:conserved membrane hypothetical protein [uncultured Alphaproteobacteria bacterium]